MTQRVPPSVALKVFCTIRTSSWAGAPPGDMSFKWLHQKCFDHEHDGDESQSISQDKRHVEQLERTPDLEADPIRAPKQLDDQYDFPDQRQARPGRRSDVGRELWHDDMAQPRPRAHTEHLRHLVELAIQGARAF